MATPSFSFAWTWLLQGNEGREQEGPLTAQTTRVGCLLPMVQAQPNEARRVQPNEARRVQPNGAEAWHVRTLCRVRAVHVRHMLSEVRDGLQELALQPVTLRSHLRLFPVHPADHVSHSKGTKHTRTRVMVKTQRQCTRNGGDGAGEGGVFMRMGKGGME